MKKIMLLIVLSMLVLPVVNAALPSIIVYKTTGDYSTLVPVGLSEDNTKIISYSGISNIYYNGELAYPTKLKKGYLLDNRGVNSNSAFLEINYEDYSKLSKTPSVVELYDMILDKDPFLEMYDCGNRINEDLNYINEIIEKNQLMEKCEVIVNTNNPEPQPNLEPNNLIYWIIGIIVVLIIIGFLIAKLKK